MIISSISVAPTMNTWKVAAFPKTTTIEFKGVLLDPLAESMWGFMADSNRHLFFVEK